MEKVSFRRDKWRDLVFAGIVILVVTADQLTKWWIRSSLSVGQVLWDAGFLQIIRVNNTGAAFGIFKGHSIALLIVDIIGIAAILFVVFVLRRRWSFLDSMWIKVGAALITAGTIGNLIDRMRFGSVTDWIDFKVWPVWNIADSCVTAGTIVLAVYLIFVFGRTQKSK
jgi:signal peptidase II